MGCRRPAIHRFRGRHRRAQHRPPSSARHGGRGAAGAGVHPYLLSRLALRILRASGRAAECAGARRIRKEDLVFEFRRRGHRERHQDCALSHQAFRGDCVFRRLSRPHSHDHGADRQGHAVQARLRTVSCRGLSRGISAPVSRHHDGAGARRFGPAVPRRRRSEVGRGHYHRAGAGRGRLQRRARRVPACAAPSVRRARHRHDRRRSSGRHGTHRQDVFDRALGRGA